MKVRLETVVNYAKYLHLDYFILSWLKRLRVIVNTVEPRLYVTSSLYPNCFVNFGHFLCDVGSFILKVKDYKIRCFCRISLAFQSNKLNDWSASWSGLQKSSGQRWLLTITRFCIPSYSFNSFSLVFSLSYTFLNKNPKTLIGFFFHFMTTPIIRHDSGPVFNGKSTVSFLL